MVAYQRQPMRHRISLRPRSARPARPRVNAMNRTAVNAGAYVQPMPRLAAQSASMSPRLPSARGTQTIQVAKNPATRNTTRDGIPDRGSADFDSVVIVSCWFMATPPAPSWGIAVGPRGVSYWAPLVDERVSRGLQCRNSLPRGDLIISALAIPEQTVFWCILGVVARTRAGVRSHACRRGAPTRKPGSAPRHRMRGRVGVPGRVRR